MVVDSSKAYTGSTVVKGQRHRVTSILKARLLTNNRQRGEGCLYEFLVQLDGCTVSSLAEWVDEKDLQDCIEIIKEFLGTIMRVLLLLLLTRTLQKKAQQCLRRWAVLVRLRLRLCRTSLSYC